MEIFLEKYELISCLNRNEINSVYLVEHRTLHHRRIIKKMQKENNFQLKEVEILKSVSHHGIPKIIDIVEERDFLYIVREYAEGRDLFSIREEREFSYRELYSIAMQLADILYYLHEELETPIIYRDLKPENIIMDDKGMVHLIDFGIARFAHPERKRDTQFLGTKAYAAPEQFGIFRSDERSDIYAFGMTLYYLLTKHQITQLPYQRLSMEDYFLKHSPSFVQLIYDCGEPQREKRPESFSVIKKRLETPAVSAVERRIPDQAQVFMGMKHGCGTSYLLYCMALADARAGKKTAILDWSESKQISKLAYCHAGTEMRKNSFQVEGVDIFPESEAIPLDLTDRDAVWIDYGVYADEKMRICKEQNKSPNLVCGAQEWDLWDLDELIFTKHLIQENFVINFGDRECLEKLVTEYPEGKFRIFPYTENPEAYLRRKHSESELQPAGSKASKNFSFWKKGGRKNVSEKEAETCDC